MKKLDKRKNAGYSLIAEPDGSGLGMSLNLLSGSPFNDFFIPGLFLFVVNGLFNLAGSILAFCNFRLTAYSCDFGHSIFRVRIGNSSADLDIGAGLFRRIKSYSSTNIFYNRDN